MSRTKAPTMAEGFNTISQALKDDVLALVEASLKKTENGLKYLENEVHKLKAKSFVDKSITTQKKKLHKNGRNMMKKSPRKR